MQVLMFDFEDLPDVFDVRAETESKKERARGGREREREMIEMEVEKGRKSERGSDLGARKTGLVGGRGRDSEGVRVWRKEGRWREDDR